MTREYFDFLVDMHENANRAINFAAGMDYDTFAKDDKTVYAVIRAIEIIGEAASKLPKTVLTKYPDLPWRDIISMRNKLVHAYFGIKVDVIWQTIQDDLPLITQVLAVIIKNEKDS
jgi:uncharacterized protein with HEPN domain